MLMPHKQMCLHQYHDVDELYEKCDKCQTMRVQSDHDKDMVVKAVKDHLKIKGRGEK